MIKIFEDFKKPDLRKIGKYVLCIKDHKNSFTEGKYYKVDGMFGDPQRAINEFGMNDYMPVECISKIFILNDKNRREEFFVNRKYYKNAGFDIYSKDFFKYFEITEIEKYNL